MRDEWRQAGLLPSLQQTGRLDRRTLLRTAGALGLAGPFGVISGRMGAAAQSTGGAIVRSPSRAQVMEEILAAYPLQRQGAPEGGKVIVANLGDVESVNPLLGGSGPTIEFLSLVYESLVGFHPVDGTIVPGLADFELAADGVTYTFHIHPDARFHDGAPVTAADAEFTLGTFLDPTSLTYSAGVKEMLKEYRAVDDRTFVLISNSPIASLLYDVPLVVMPKHLWEGVALEDWPTDPGSIGQDPDRVIGSGPFRFVEWVQGDHVTLARNDDYWDRELSRVPYLDNLVLQVVADSAARALGLETGVIDVGRLPPTDVDRLTRAGGLAVVSYDSTGFIFYAYQLDPKQTPLFQDKTVRQALFVALDRQAIVDSILLSHGEVARGTIAPLSPHFRPDEFERYDYDPDLARDLLAQAGWADADGDGVLEKGGQRFSFTMPTRDDNTVDNLLNAYMQDAWAQIGVELTPEPMPFPSVLDRSDAGDFDMIRFRTGWTADPGQGSMFATDFSLNGYSNAEFDRLEREQRSTLDPDQRIDLIIEQAKIVWDELPIGILAFLNLSVGYTERLHNNFPNGFTGLMWSAPFWYLEE